MALAAWLVGPAGWRDVGQAAERLGVGGFLEVCLASLGLFGLLGIAWLSAASEPMRRLPLFAFARMAREAVSDFLPFAQIGGLAAGARILRVNGVPAPRVYASMIVDQVTEMASQLVFTMMGVAVAVALLTGKAQSDLRLSIIVGTGLLVVALSGLMLGQRHFLRVAAALTCRILPGLSATFVEIERELVQLYARRGAVLVSFVANLLAWLAMAGVAWLALRLMGWPLDIWRLVAIESVIAVVRSVAFLLPGALGLQEAAYAIVGPVFGLPVGAGVALSLVKRARDAALALGSLLLWQALEVRRSGRRVHRPPADDAEG